MSDRPLQLTLHPARQGRMGGLDLGRDYLAGVKARARLLAKATRWRQDKPETKQSSP